ncbi:MAG: hypothetical protein AABY03_00135 [Nanoarchaeota archaeon]
MKDLLKYAGVTLSSSLAIFAGTYFAISNLKEPDAIVGKIIYGRNNFCVVDSLTPGFELEKVLKSLEQNLKFRVTSEIARRNNNGEFEFTYNNIFEIKMKCRNNSRTI